MSRFLCRRFQNFGIYSCPELKYEPAAPIRSQSDQRRQDRQPQQESPAVRNPILFFVDPEKITRQKDSYSGGGDHPVPVNVDEIMARRVMPSRIGRRDNIGGDKSGRKSDQGRECSQVKHPGCSEMEFLI